MQYLLTIALLFSVIALRGQTIRRSNRLPVDTCTAMAKDLAAHTVDGAGHTRPLYLANGVVVNWQQLDTTLIEDVVVLNCTEAFRSYHYAGVHGVFSIRTLQQFTTETSVTIGKKMPAHDAVIYALNGYYIRDSTLKIAVESIKAVDFHITKGGPGINSTPAVINIWTLTTAERQPLSAALLLGVVNTTSSKNK
jgi:hypothetical protein